MKIFIELFISVIFCAWVESCVTVFKKCREDNDCCANHYCKDVDGQGNGNCAQNTCKPLISKKLIIECFTSFNQTTSCNKTLYPNLRATFRCNSPIYWQVKSPEYNEIICKNGQWNRPLLDNFCEVDCGRSTASNSQSAVAGEQKSEIGEFPWHAGIYEFDPMTREYDQICGGTLISLKVVISAAHCFAPFNMKTQKVEIIEKLWTLKVAFGKYYRNINATEKFVQMKDVARIEIPKEYKGKLSHFEGDISFVFLKDEVEYSRAVLPVCIDVGEEHFEENPLMQGTMGKFAGWDIKNSKMYDEKLMVTNMPFISKDQCLKKLGYEWFYYIKPQKLCAGDEKSRYNVCEGNGGSGLVFADPTTNKYYLRGVVSQGPKCLWDNGIAVFTTLSPYKKLVKKYSSDNCEALSSEKLSIECFSFSNQTISCNKALETNSWAKFNCKSPIYSKIKEPEYNEIHCMNGEWNRPLMDDFCEVECGKPSANLTTHRSRRKILEIAELPWHAGIYELQYPPSNEWEQICGGTLISSKVVVSAASCFDKNKRILDPINIALFKVAVGKFYRKINDREDTHAQIKEVASVQIPPDNDRNQYKGDIAFVMLKESIEYTLNVLPICIDYGVKGSENDELVKGAMGKIAGWGLTNQGIPSERLMLTEMEFIPSEDCKTVWNSYLSEDKFCAKGRKTRYNVCETYRGGGIIFADPKKEKFYLRGILSSGPCDFTDEVVLFTALWPYKDLVEKYSEGKCEPLASEKLEIMCFTPTKEMIPCNKTMEKNSRAAFHCKRPIYWEVREPEYIEITCKNGQWDRPLVDDFCEPDCGRSISKMEQQNLGDKYKIANMEFPWHVWVYEYNPIVGIYDQQCGGTLISQSIVISAAKCYTRLKLSPHTKEIFEVKDLSTFKVAVGKYWNSINSTQDTFAQIRDIARVEIPSDFQDYNAPSAGDIAIVVLKEKVEYSWAVQPVCIDIGDYNFESDQLIPGAKGKFPGLRIYRAHISGKSLQWGKKPFVPRDDCKKRISKEWRHLVEDDIFCVGDGNDRSSVCNTDSGGGLVFLEPTKKKYYLRGIANAGPPCGEKNFGIFTNLTVYRELIERYIPSESGIIPVQGIFPVTAIPVQGIFPVTAIFPDDTEKNRPTRMNICLGLNKTGCHNINCCKDLKCSNGPNKIWSTGKCIEIDADIIPIQFPGSSKFELHDDDVDDDSYFGSNNNYNNYNRNYCEPVASKKLKISCFTPANERTSCQEKLPNNSSAIYHCNNPIYLEMRKPEYTEITCRNGQWNRPLIDNFCEVGCGRSISDVATPAIKDGIFSEWGEFPWHAAIYKLVRLTGQYEQMCGGSLISPRVIITAAHCVANYNINKREIVTENLSNLKASVGNYYRSFNGTEDAAFAQIQDIAKIEVSERYQETYSLYDGDIAFLILKGRVEYSRAVLPICLDVGQNSFEKKQLVQGAYGVVAGWGITSDESQVSEKLRVAQLPFVMLDECRKNIGQQWLQYLNKDKLCIGMKIAEMKICGGDSGGGLVFEHPITKRYYLRGIASLGSKCHLQEGFALFTDLSIYKSLVEKHLRLQ